MIKLSNSEIEVMKVIWQKQMITSNEIVQALSHKNWNANTIRTFISRLISKKAVTSIKKLGKSYLYIPIIDEKEFCQQKAKQFINQYYNGSIIACLENFIEYETKPSINLELKKIVRKLDEMIEN